jgi:D-beta-D-heptose 7-phosphate kinase/D-beta-D-heptose 1-phosphate adenosyltransferase
MLNYAMGLGDYLLVGIDTDRRIKELKGSDRPIYNQADRKYMIESLKAVNEVQLFDTDEQLINMVKEYQPDIMVKGSDHKNGIIFGIEYIKTLDFFERRQDYATTKTIQDIINRR